MKSFMDVAAAILRRDGLYLISRRPDHTYMGGLWEFPGGKRNAEESFEECLHRELHEELGVDVAVGELQREIRHEYEDRVVRLRFFECELLDGAVW